MAYRYAKESDVYGAMGVLKPGTSYVTNRFIKAGNLKKFGCADTLFSRTANEYVYVGYLKKIGYAIPVNI